MHRTFNNVIHILTTTSSINTNNQLCPYNIMKHHPLAFIYIHHQMDDINFQIHLKYDPDVHADANTNIDVGENWISYMINPR